MTTAIIIRPNKTTIVKSDGHLEMLGDNLLKNGFSAKEIEEKPIEIKHAVNFYDFVYLLEGDSFYLVCHFKDDTGNYINSSTGKWAFPITDGVNDLVKIKLSKRIKQLLLKHISL